MNYGLYSKQTRPSIRQIKVILDKARDYGILKLDTAVAYRSSNLGCLDLRDFSVATKLSLTEFYKSEGDYNKFIGEIKIAGVERFDQILLHTPMDLKAPDIRRLIDLLHRCKADEVCENIGVSIYQDQNILDLARFPELTSIQAPFNAFDGTFQRETWRQFFVNNSKNVSGRSIFLQGLLTQDRFRIKGFNRWCKVFSAWERFCLLNSISKVTAALKFVDQTDFLSELIVGVNSVGEISDISKSLSSNTYVNFEGWEVCSDSNLIDPRCWED